MVKEHIKYKDFNGNDREEDFYFNLTEAEVFEMQMSTSGGYKAMIESIIAAQDMPSLIKIFKELLLKSYGKKSLDGKFFEKSEEISTAFSQTNAYVKLYMELVTDDKKAAQFINGLMDVQTGPQDHLPASTN